MKRTYDAVVVGNGIIGQAIAWELKKRDRSLRVIVIGPHNRPGAASAAAGAMLGCFAEITHTSLRSSAGRTKFKLSRMSSKKWELWIRQLNEMKLVDRYAQML